MTYSSTLAAASRVGASGFARRLARRTRRAVVAGLGAGVEARRKLGAADLLALAVVASSGADTAIPLASVAAGKRRSAGRFAPVKDIRVGGNVALDHGLVAAPVVRCRNAADALEGGRALAVEVVTRCGDLVALWAAGDNALDTDLARAAVLVAQFGTGVAERAGIVEPLARLLAVATRVTVAKPVAAVAAVHALSTAKGVEKVKRGGVIP